MQENNIDIQDVENFRGGKEAVFSHQSLVMKSMNRSIELGGHEMHLGINETIRMRDGNIKQVYRESTQEAFVESVKSCEMILSCDLDDEAIKEISKIKKKLKEHREGILKEQWKWYQSLNYTQKEGKIVSEKAFVSKTSYYIRYLKIEVEAYREIFSELNKLTKRLNFFTSEDFEA